VRSADGGSDVPLATYAYFADRDPLTKVVLERMLADVSTHRYRRTQEPVGSEVERAARSTSRSAVSHTFVERTRQSLGELMSCRLRLFALSGLDGPDRRRRKRPIRNCEFGKVARCVIDPLAQRRGVLKHMNARDKILRRREDASPASQLILLEQRHDCAAR
jgi:hypothetical protein